MRPHGAAVSILIDRSSVVSISNLYCLMNSLARSTNNLIFEEAFEPRSSNKMSIDILILENQDKATLVRL